MNAQNRVVTYAMAIATLIMDETLSDKMRERKFSAVQRAIALADSYANDGIREDLVDTIMEKKTALILDAKTVADVEKAANPPKPHYTGAEWIESPFSVPEEEMVLLSKTSLRGPLTEPGYQRYRYLFEQIFGASAESMMAQT